MTSPTEEDVLATVKESIDGEYHLHAVLPTGESQHLRFYLVIWEEPHRDAGDDLPDDASLLKERYFQIPKDTAPPEADLSPTWKTNGIARRDVGGLKSRLVRAYARVSNGESGDYDTDDPLWLESEDA